MKVRPRTNWERGARIYRSTGLTLIAISPSILSETVMEEASEEPYIKNEAGKQIGEVAPIC